MNGALAAVQKTIDKMGVANGTAKAA